MALISWQLVLFDGNPDTFTIQAYDVNGGGDPATPLGQLGPGGAFFGEIVAAPSGEDLYLVARNVTEGNIAIAEAILYAGSLRAGHVPTNVGPRVFNDAPLIPDKLHITRGVAYDGTSREPFAFDAGRDIDGLLTTFTIRRGDDDNDTIPLFQISLAAVGNIATFPLSTDETNSIPISCQPFDQKFDVLVEENANSYLDIARGTVNTVDSVTRPPVVV